jgi:hypothetical protein
MMQRLNTACDQKYESGDDVADADALMIDTGEYAADTGRCFPDRSKPRIDVPSRPH